MDSHVSHSPTVALHVFEFLSPLSPSCCTHAHTHTHTLTHTHTPSSNKPKKWDKLVRITSPAHSLDSVLSVLTSGPPTQTPGSTGTVFSIKKSWRQTFFPPNFQVNELWCVESSLKHTFNVVFESSLTEMADWNITGLGVKMRIMTAIVFSFTVWTSPWTDMIMQQHYMRESQAVWVCLWDCCCSAIIQGTHCSSNDSLSILSQQSWGWARISKVITVH